MFVYAAVEVPLPFLLARPLLWAVAQDDAALGGVSRRAHQAGLRVVQRVGPFGDKPGLAKTVAVQSLPPRQVDGGVRVPLRWSATGRGGQLFPTVDADIDLVPLDDVSCLLSIKAVYQPPMGVVGGVLDDLLLHRAARATMRSLLASLASRVLAPETATEGIRQRRRIARTVRFDPLPG